MERSLVSVAKRYGLKRFISVTLVTYIFFIVIIGI